MTIVVSHELILTKRFLFEKLNLLYMAKSGKRPKTAPYFFVAVFFSISKLGLVPSFLKQNLSNLVLKKKKYMIKLFSVKIVFFQFLKEKIHFLDNWKKRTIDIY